MGFDSMWGRETINKQYVVYQVALSTVKKNEAS